MNISKTHNVSKNVESEALKSKPLSSSAVTKYYRTSVDYDRVWSGTCMCNEYIEHERPQYNLVISWPLEPMHARLYRSDSIVSFLLTKSVI